MKPHYTNTNNPIDFPKMNKRILELMKKVGTDTSGKWMGIEHAEKLAELIVQDCANFVRENYDHESAESIAWCMEIEYGLHGDYA